MVAEADETFATAVFLKQRKDSIQVINVKRNYRSSSAARKKVFK